MTEWETLLAEKASEALGGFPLTWKAGEPLTARTGRDIMDTIAKLARILAAWARRKAALPETKGKRQ